MAFNGHFVIDADSHIREYWDFDKTYKDNIDPEYRDKYARFSAAVKANQKRTGDVGLGGVLWPRLPGHPMGIYDAFDAPPERGGYGATVVVLRRKTGNGIPEAGDA